MIEQVATKEVVRFNMQFKCDHRCENCEKQATPTQESIVRRMKNRDRFDANFKEMQGKYAEKWIAGLLSELTMMR